MTGLSSSFAAADPKGETSSLLKAVSYDPVKSVRKLLMNGADINQRNKAECTPLIWAAFKKRPEIVRLLIEYGAELNLKNIRGSTALMLSAKTGDADTAHLLISSGADIDKKDNEGATAFDYARRYGREEVMKVLEAAVRARNTAASAEREREGHIVALEKQQRLNKAAKKNQWRPI